MATPLPARGRRRGFAVLFALAILVLLSVFALSFANLTRLERLAAANVRLQVQAAALAEAGIGQACAEARNAARQRPWVEAHDWWANGAYYPAQPACPRCNAASVAPAAECTACAYCYDCDKVNKPIVGACGNCGAAVRATAIDPRGVVLATNPFGGRDQVQVRSFDVASKLDVNLRTPGLKQALTSLGLTSSEADDLIAKRNAAGGLRSREELRTILGDAKYRQVRDFLTVFSSPAPHTADSRSGDLPWSYAGTISPCSPVDINAASERVLEAVMTDITGSPIELVADGKADWLLSTFVGDRGKVRAGNAISINAAKAKQLAKEIVACRERKVGVSGLDYSAYPEIGGAFRTWRQFELFLEKNGLLTPAERALLRAATHAESRAMGYNPDASRRQVAGVDGGMFDRLSVSSFVTRFSLGGAGILEVSATGWITDARGVSAAQADIERVVRVFTPLTFGTQAELEAMWQGPSRNVYQSMPEPVPWTAVTPDPLDGHIRLTTEHQQPGGNKAYSSSFRAPLPPDDLPDPSGPFDLSGRAIENNLRDKGVVAPDGVITYRIDRQSGTGVTLATGSVCPYALSEDGSFELWVKLVGDVSIGTDEALVTVVIDESQRWQIASLVNALSATITGFTQPTPIGSTIKLERFGTKVRVTWFYWGQGQGAVSPFVLLLAEVRGDISSWKPGEWHHVMVSWKQSFQDWVRAQVGNPVTMAERPTDGIRMWLDGSEVNEGLFKANAMTHNGPATAVNSVLYNLGKAVSTPMIGSVIVGGYTHTGQGILVHSTGTPTGSFLLQRYANCTIDDVFVYDAPYDGVSTSALPRNRADRYHKNPKVAAPNPKEPGITLHVPIGTYAEVGSVGVEVELPFGATSSAELVVAGETVDTSDPALPKPVVLAHPAAVAQAAVNPAQPSLLPVTVYLHGDGLTSPVLESVTVLLLPPLQVIEEARDLP